MRAAPHIFLVLLFCLTAAMAKAQYDVYHMQESEGPDSNASQELSLGFSNWNYLRNHEYFNKIWDGYTLFGSQFNPRLRYQPHKDLLLEGGLFIDQAFGRDQLQLQPTFRAKWRKKSATFVFGTLDGNINHRFLDPVYDYERIISKRNEYGVQMLLDKSWLWMDLFINWDKFIERGDSSQEKFTAGFSSQLSLLKHHGLYLKAPVQGYLRHSGGQINVGTQNLSTLSNMAAGLSLGKEWTKGNVLREARLEGYYVAYNDLSPNPGQVYKNGSAQMANLLLKSRWNIDLSLSYWSGNEFFSALGNPLYHNASAIGEPYYQKQRELFFLRLLWDEKLFDHFYAHFRLEPYYDMKASLFEYSYSLFITYRQNFFLKKVQKH